MGSFAQTAMSYLILAAVFTPAMAFILFHDTPKWDAWTAFLSPVRFRNWSR